MKVTQTSIQTFEVELSLPETEELTAICQQVGIKQNVLVNHLLASGLHHAADALIDLKSDICFGEVDQDGNSIKK